MIKFVKLTDEEFKSKIKTFFEDNYGEWTFTIRKQFREDGTVDFDFENYECEPETSGTYRDRPCNRMLGFQLLDGNNLQYWGCIGGGDWEWPVYFILYWDGRKVRGYVPLCSGNRFNRNTYKAYGNADNYKYDEDHNYIQLEYTDDAVDLKNQYPELFADTELKDIEGASDPPELTEEDAQAIRAELLNVFVKKME